MPATVRQVSCLVTLASTVLPDVQSARGQVSADGGWPTCSVFTRIYPRDGGGDPIDEENDIDVVAGAGNNVTRFTGRLRRFRPSAFPRGLELVCVGTLAYAAEWSPSADPTAADLGNIIFQDAFPTGATDQVIVRWVLDHVPGVTYSSGDIGGTGVTLGTEAPEAFDWKAGTSAWTYIQEIDRATLYRTYQTMDGTIRRVRMIGHPHNGTEDFTLAEGDILEGSIGSRDTERTRNAVTVGGHDYGDGLGPVLGFASGTNGFQGDGADPDFRRAEPFASDLIEDGNDVDGTALGLGGIDAQDIADAIINDVNKEFVDADILSWRDDTHGPGLTCLLDAFDRLHINESMWVQGYSWEVSENGWQSRYVLTGGGLEQTYTPPDV